MSIEKEFIAAAGNTEVPAYLVLAQQGFSVSRLQGPSGEEYWVAENETIKLTAASPLELIGLLTIRNHRGSHWFAADHEIEEFLATYFPERSE